MADRNEKVDFIKKPSYTALRRSPLQESIDCYERVMNDERSYDQIQGPNRLKVKLEERIQKYAEKGRELKTKHFKKSHNYSSFATQANIPSYTFDKTVTREQAMKPFLKIPEGAPFWKYNVKDEVITVPVKSYTISENPEAGHTIEMRGT